MHIGGILLVVFCVLFLTLDEAGLILGAAILGLLGLLALALFSIETGGSEAVLWVAGVGWLLLWLCQLPPSPHSLPYRAGAQVRRFWLWATTWGRGK